MKKQIHHILAKTPLILRVVSLYVLLWPVGSYAISSFTTTSAQDPVVVMAEPIVQEAEPVPVEPAVIRGTARQLSLPRIGLTKEIIDGGYDENTNDWTLTDDKVQYALMTESINDTSGQTMLYGHNTSAVFEPVKHVQLGDELLITSAEGGVFVYTYTHDRFVEPTDISVLTESPDTARVVLMTCEGWLSETRRLLYFDFKEIRS